MPPAANPAKNPNRNRANSTTSGTLPGSFLTGPFAGPCSPKFHTPILHPAFSSPASAESSTSCNNG